MKKGATGKKVVRRRPGTLKQAKVIDEHVFGFFNAPTQKGHDAALLLVETAFRLKVSDGKLQQRGHKQPDGSTYEPCGSSWLPLAGELVAKAILTQDVQFFERIVMAMRQLRVDPATGDWIACDPLRAELWRLNNAPDFQDISWTLKQIDEQLPKKLRGSDERTIRRACKDVGLKLKKGRPGRPSK